MAGECVRMVYAAYQTQCDAEFVARVGRKNIQVMDRISKMSTHKEMVIRKLSSATTLEALQQGENLDGFIPVYWCRGVLGIGEQGTCHVSLSAITFTSTKIITLGMGKGKVTRIPLEEVMGVKVSPPNRVSVEVRGGKVVSWVPLLCSSRRLKDLILAVLDVDRKKTIKLTEQGGLLYASEPIIEREGEGSDDEFIVITSPRGTKVGI